MTNNMTKIYVGIDNDKVEATGEVLEQILKDRAELEQKKASDAQQESDALAAKTALLERLGISADEAKLLLA
mgnify:CR=1 FL=1